jgi:hypothetical protein
LPGSAIEAESGISWRSGEAALMAGSLRGQTTGEAA